MNNKELQIGSTQVLEVLPYFAKDDLEKIPKKFVDYLKQNEREEYRKEFDFSKPMEELELDYNAKIILATIYRTFWANAEEKQEFDKYVIQNDSLYEQNLNKKYDVNSIFGNSDSLNKKVDTIVNTQDINDSLIENDAWYIKILKKIKNIFGRIGKRK